LHFSTISFSISGLARTATRTDDDPSSDGNKHEGGGGDGAANAVAPAGNSWVGERGTVIFEG